MTHHTAQVRVALTADGKIVPDTDPKAQSLFAGVGAVKTDEELKDYPNAKEFFDGFDKGKKAEKDNARVEAKDEPEAPKTAHKRHAKVDK